MARFAVGLSLSLVLVASFSFAQTDLSSGIQLFSTNNFGIDLASSNVDLTIPARSKIGKLPFSSMFVGNYHAFQGANSWVVTSALAMYVLPIVNLHGTISGSCPSTKEEVTISIIDGTGASHAVPGAWIGLCSGQNGNQNNGTWVTSDGSGYTLVVTNGIPTVYDRAGVQNIMTGNLSVGYSTAWKAIDPDGATVSLNTTTGNWTDSLNTTALTQTYNGSNAFIYSYLDASGNTQSYTMTYAASKYNFATNFGCTGWPEYSATYAPVVSVSTPTGGSYNFTYESTFNKSGYYTGRIKTITFPSGGSISYSYSGGNHGINCTSGVVPTLTVTVNDNNGNIGVWTYVNSNGYNASLCVAGAGPCNYTVTRTDPAGNQTVYSFAGEYQTQAVYYQGTSTVLKTVTTCYNGNLTSCATPSTVPTLPITETDVYTSLGTSPTNRIQTTFDASFGNVTHVYAYDFGASSYTLNTFIGYGSWNGSTCVAVGNYIYDKPCEMWKGPNGSGNKKSFFNYDPKGHLKQVQDWVTGNTYLITNLSYNSNGTVNTVTDPNGLVTTLHYDGSCNSILSTSTTNSFNSLTSSQAYDAGCNGAVVVTKTGVDGNPWTFAYNDPLWRQTSSTDPTGYALNMSYTTNSVASSSSFNGSTLKHVSTLDGLGRTIFNQTYQGSSGNYDTVKTTYDALGRVSNVSAPFTSGLGTGTCTSPCTQSAITYDALGRVLTATDANNGKTAHTYSGANDLAVLSPAPAGENVKQRQSLFDGLGRLTSVCEISSTLPGVAACTGQANTPTGYLTSYTYDPVGRLTGVTQGTQTRRFVYDGLDRMTSETNPESGTATYVWDTDTFCGGGYTSNGDLLRLTRRVSTCFSYDGLHRLTEKSYSDGLTGASHFRWDADNNWGHATGQGGKIASAFTCPAGNDNCSGASMVTIEGFQYDTRGNLGNIYQSSPNSGGVVGVGSGRDALGNINLLNIPGVPSLSAQTWDGEGRVTSIIATGTVPMSSAVYGPFGPSSVTYGSGDKDIFTYDNVGRVTSYQFSVGTGSQNYKGVVTWNSNGTVKQLTTTNSVPGVNPSVAATVSYTYDDLGRVSFAQDNAVPIVLSQSYSYDRYGNDTKHGQPYSWLPPYGTGYDASTNRYVIGGSCSSGIAYDVDGNVLCDTFHTYTWDGEDRLASVDGLPLVRDAFGAILEASNFNGTTYEHLNLHGIADVEMWGQTLAWAKVPLPGGGNVEYQNGSMLGFNHPDWEGSVRLSTTPSRTLWSSSEYAPFGEAYDQDTVGWCCDFAFNGGSPMTTVPGMYDTPARELHPVQGRWIQPDPAGLAAVDPTNPQTWNRYAYVMNNPVSFTDPTGLACWPFEMQRMGSCAPFMNNGMNFGANWNEFYVMTSDIQVYGPKWISFPLNQPGPTIYWPNMYGTTQLTDGYYLGWGPIGDGLDVSIVFSGKLQWTGATIRAVNPPPDEIRATSSWWEKLFMRLGCLAGADPENMGPAPGAPQDSTDSTIQTEGQQQLYGPNKSGRDVVYNSGSEVPSVTTGGAAHIATASDCWHRIPD